MEQCGETGRFAPVVIRYAIGGVDERLDPDLLGEDPFEIDTQLAHLFKHPHLGLEDVYEVWARDRFSLQQDRQPTGWS
jgi:hypothetical protein